MRIANFLLLSIIVSFVGACGSPPLERDTLRKIDVIGERGVNTDARTPPKSDSEIRKAYASYLKHASKNDKSRINALNRLAQLEFELSEQILKKKSDKQTGDIDALSDELYNAKLERTIDLLSTSLRDYPDAKGNDTTLYQLAKAYDQKGDYRGAHSTLEKLVKKYPKSKFYIESQFRLAEDAFSSKRYTVAEDKYTEIIGAKKNNIFYEKSLYKRGWSRFKQEFYLEAADDFIQVIKYNRFDDYPKLAKSKQDLFNEYFRAIGLTFSYLGGADALNSYFSENPGFQHVYYAYAHVSDIYAKQERYNDAVNTLHYFARHYAASKHSPEALLKAVSVWKAGGFTSKMNESLVSFYKTYHPDSTYWHKLKSVDQHIYNHIKNTLREYILEVAANHHKQFLLHKNISDFAAANIWYTNYLKHYSAYSRKDNIHYLYGTLLSENRDYINALHQFEKAGFDSEIIINNDAAYESIIISSRLARSSRDKAKVSAWLQKLMHYSTLYSQQNTNDKRTTSVISHACELAYKNNLYKETIELAELITNDESTLASVNIKLIKAHSYFKLKHYTDAESTYLSVLEDKSAGKKYLSAARNGLAISIYYQGKSAADKNNSDSAIRHYARIASVAPNTATAATGMYDAIALSMQHELWAEAIKHIKTFQRLYPQHKLSRDVSKKLSVAYLNSKQDIAAARELESISKDETDKEYKLAALWKAAELYEAKQEYSSAIRSYEEYARNFTRPFPQYIESMNKLVELYTKINKPDRAGYWRKIIVKADSKTPTTLKTERTKLIASTAALQQAQSSYKLFNRIKLVHPLAKNLRVKKKAMQQTVNLYGRASAYGVAETATEATYAIAAIYNEFSKALLQSERPRHLNKDELEQYQILLEDQAFPFEEKAIEFYEINMTHVKDDVYDEWVKLSHTRLKQLFPVRYQREAKLEDFINVLH